MSRVVSYAWRYPRVLIGLAVRDPQSWHQIGVAYRWGWPS